MEQETNSSTTPSQTSEVANGDQEISSFPVQIKTIGESKAVLNLQVTVLDTVQDIKHYLYDSMETCYITNYHLSVGDKKLNDYVELGEVPEITANATLEMQESLYDERSIRVHVRRLRDILSSHESASSPSFFSKITKDVSDSKADNIKEDVPIESGQSLLSNYFPSQEKAVVSCVKNITFSGWNPPPGNRKLFGDLIYLEIETLENKTYHVTGWSKGFFVNASTSNNFNPNASDKPFYSHDLVTLLNQISPSFKKGFGSLLNGVYQRHPYESFPVPFPVTSWVNRKEKHVYDLNRSEDSVNLNSDSDFRGQLRDWNEEYQSCKELPKETIQERIIRDRALFKVNADFVEAAIKGACAIVERTVPPINPLDSEKAHMFIYNNIFFSFALDGRDLFKDCGGDNTAFVSVNNDLKGVQLMNRADVKGLYTLATAIIDYRGHRLVAQSIIPGILQREQTSNVVYGSIDNGKTVTNDASFHSLLQEAAKFLHIKEHKVIDQQQNEVSLVTPVECKGIIGTDNRKYILDLVRLTPRDSNYTGKQHQLTTLRPELVVSYYDFLRQQEIIKRRQEKLKEKELQKEASSLSEQTSSKEEKASDDKAEAKEDASEDKDEKKKEEEEKEDDIEINIDIEFPSWNPNVFCEYNLVDSTQDEANVSQMSKYLLETAIPAFIEDLIWVIPLPIDGVTLTQAMHNHGINMRYLGKLATLTEKIPVLKDLIIQEMIVRSSKHVLRSILRETEDYKLAPAIAHFFNCLLGNAKATKDEIAIKKKKKDIPSVFGVSSNSLWSDITEQVKSRYDYSLPKDKDPLKYIIKSMATLRGLALKVGIQLEARDYDFSLECPFQSTDVLNLYPVLKHSDPQSFDGQNLLEAGKTYLSQGRLDIAYELLTEALAIFHQVYGPMHKDTALCYTNLGTVLYHAKDLSQAIEHQQKATVIYERVLGLDHYDTAHSYMTLSLLSHSIGKNKESLNYIYHTLYLIRLIAGVNHPDTANIYINVAQMLQEIQHHKSAIEFYQKALTSYDQLVGPNTLQSASIYHAIALAYSQLGDFKDALAYEKKNYAILHEKVGDDDLRTIESNLCLKQFTTKAVQAQMETKKAQRDVTSQLTKEKLNKLRGGASGLSIPQPGKSSMAGSTNTPMGARPLNEILAYINGSSKKPKSLSERNGKGGVLPKKSSN